MASEKEDQTKKGGSGFLVVLEGIDGSGKHTQAALLADALKSAGIGCELVTFPRYTQGPVGPIIRKYLQGAFGAATELSPELVAPLFAVDRAIARPSIKAVIDAGGVVICDRYAASNAAHQGAKLPIHEREPFLRWCMALESSLGALEPDIVFFLNVRPQDSFVRSKTRARAEDRETDEHESKASYLNQAYNAYMGLISLKIGGPWVIVDCYDEFQSSLPPNAIHQKILYLVQCKLSERNTSEEQDLQATLLRLFDDAMASPDTSRGLNVEATSQHLRRSALHKSRSMAEFDALMKSLTDLYISQFAHSMTVLPNLASDIRQHMNAASLPFEEG